jgi:putative transposase
MREIFLLVIHLLTILAKFLRPGGVRAVAAESLLLKHQLLISQRSRRRAPTLTSRDRFLLSLTALFLNLRRVPTLAVILKPATLLKFHQALVQHKCHLLFSSSSRRKPGPHGPSPELIAAIVEMTRRNPRFGCPRIAQQISRAFGLAINKDVVRRVLALHVRPESGHHGPSWLTFIGHIKDSLWSVDLFRCESILLKSHWVMVVMDVCTRRLIGFSAAPADSDGVSVCRMFTQAMAGRAPPTHLSSDNDPLFTFHRWRANLRVLDVDEIKTLPLIPCSHPFVERLIGTIRREYLDYVLFWNVDDLTRKLDRFKAYYNEDRVHRSLYATPAQESGKPPPPCAALGRYAWHPQCRGLFHTPMAA